MVFVSGSVTALAITSPFSFLIGKVSFLVISSSFGTGITVLSPAWTLLLGKENLANNCICFVSFAHTAGVVKSDSVSLMSVITSLC